MKVVYDGPFAKIRVLPVDGPEVEATRGEAIDLPDEAARELVATGEWRAADGKQDRRDKPEEGE